MWFTKAVFKAFILKIIKKEFYWILRSFCHDPRPAGLAPPLTSSSAWTWCLCMFLAMTGTQILPLGHTQWDCENEDDSLSILWNMTFLLYCTVLLCSGGSAAIVYLEKQHFAFDTFSQSKQILKALFSFLFWSAPLSLAKTVKSVWLG